MKNNKKTRILAWTLAAVMLLPQAVFGAGPGNHMTAGTGVIAAAESQTEPDGNAEKTPGDQSASVDQSAPGDQTAPAKQDEPADKEALIKQLVGAQTSAAEKAELLTGAYGATSVQYAIIDDGEITTSGHSGVYSKTENRALTADTMYGVGSVSKMFTTAVIMKLAENGRIELDKPVIRYLPEFRMADDRYREITVRMLLNHSSGLMGSNYRSAFLLDDADTKAHDELLERLSSQSLKADPGAYSTYCNDGFTLAEIVAEKATGKSFTKLVEEYISEPLSLANTKTPQDEFDRANLAKIYEEGFEKELPVDTVGIIGTGGIYSTAEDMCRFAEIFMQGDGKTAPTSVLKLATAAQTAEPEYARGIWPDKDSPEADGFGLGWDSVSAAAFAQYGIQELNKGGDTFFYHASLVVLPEKNMAAAVLSSGGSSPYNQLVAEKLLEERLEEKGELPEKKSSQERAADSGASSSSAAAVRVPDSVKEYEGYYVNMSDVMKVSIGDEGTMTVTLPGNDEYQESYSYAAGSAESEDGAYFTDKTGLVRLSFVEETNGKTYMKIEGPAIYPALGVMYSNVYSAQKLAPSGAAQSAIDGWKARQGKKYYSVDEKYTSSMYLLAAPIFEIELNDELPGYVFSNAASGPNDTKTVVQIPGSMGRDLAELHSYTKDGVEYMTNYGDTSVGEEAVGDISRTTSGDGLHSTYKIGEDGYAIWLNATSAAGRKVTITPPEKGAFFVYDGNVCVNASRVTGENTFVLPDDGTVCLAGEPGQEFTVELEPFSDAGAGTWYFEAVSRLTQLGLVTGSGDGSFGAEEEMSRAMLVTILNKMAKNEPEKYGVEYGTPAVFSDVAEDQWYAQAAAWAGGTGIVSGVGEDGQGGKLFAPDETITREQLASILYHMAQKTGLPADSEGMAIREFADEGLVSDWAAEAMRWAVGHGMLSGKTRDGDDTSAPCLDPQGAATRAEAAMILTKFMELTK